MAYAQHTAMCSQANAEVGPAGAVLLVKQIEPMLRILGYSSLQGAAFEFARAVYKNEHWGQTLQNTGRCCGILLSDS